MQEVKKNKTYVVGYTLFPRGYGGFKTRFQPFNDKRQAINFYKHLMTENKIFYESVEVESDKE